MIPYEYTLANRKPPLHIKPIKRTFICTVCGETGETTSRVQTTHLGECTRERKRRASRKHHVAKRKPKRQEAAR